MQLGGELTDDSDTVGLPSQAALTEGGGCREKLKARDEGSGVDRVGLKTEEKGLSWGELAQGDAP